MNFSRQWTFSDCWHLPIFYSSNVRFGCNPRKTKFPLFGEKISELFLQFAGMKNESPKITIMHIEKDMKKITPWLQQAMFILVYPQRIERILLYYFLEKYAENRETEEIIFYDKLTILSGHSNKRALYYICPLHSISSQYSCSGVRLHRQQCPKSKINTNIFLHRTLFAKTL